MNTRVPTVSDSSVVQEARNQARDDIARRVTTRLDTLDEKREHTNVNNIVVQEAKNQARDDVASGVATRLDTHDQKGQTNVNNIVVNGVNSDTSTKPPLIHLYNTQTNANMFQNQEDVIDRDRLAAMYALKRATDEVELNEALKAQEEKKPQHVFDKSSFEIRN